MSAQLLKVERVQDNQNVEFYDQAVWSGQPSAEQAKPFRANRWANGSSGGVQSSSDSTHPGALLGLLLYIGLPAGAILLVCKFFWFALGPAITARFQ